VAADAIGHEIHQHSVGCDERAAERGGCDKYEAVTVAAAVTASWSPAMPRMIAAGTGERVIQRVITRFRRRAQPC
jgi:hypothetical protein